MADKSKVPDFDYLCLTFSHSCADLPSLEFLFKYAHTPSTECHQSTVLEIFRSFLFLKKVISNVTFNFSSGDAPVDPAMFEHFQNLR